MQKTKEQPPQPELQPQLQPRQRAGTADGYASKPTPQQQQQQQRLPNHFNHVQPEQRSFNMSLQQLDQQMMHNRPVQPGFGTSQISPQFVSQPIIPPQPGDTVKVTDYYDGPGLAQTGPGMAHLGPGMGPGGSGMGIGGPGMGPSGAGMGPGGAGMSLGGSGMGTGSAGMGLGGAGMGVGGPGMGPGGAGMGPGGQLPARLQPVSASPKPRRQPMSMQPADLSECHICTVYNVHCTTVCYVPILCV